MHHEDVMTTNASQMFKDIYRYNSVAVAFYIVAWANAHNVTINLTKTQKLLYIAYGANLILGGDRLCGEHPQAWPYGPVFPTTRRKLLKADLYRVTMDSPEVGDLKDDTYLESLMKFVFKGFGDKTAAQLTVWSHSPNSPWDETTHLFNFKWGMEIPDSFIYDYFSTIIKVDKPATAQAQ